MLPPSQKSERLAAVLLKRQTLNGDALLKEILDDQKTKFHQGLSHAKFGSFCLSAGQLEKAEKHLQKAYQILELECKGFYINGAVQLGHLYSQKKDFKLAAEWFLKGVHQSPFGPQKGEMQPFLYSALLNGFSAYQDGLNNAAVMLTQLNDFQQALSLCETALKLPGRDPSLIINLSDILRQLGRQQQAIEMVWSHIYNEIGQQVPPFSPIKISKQSVQQGSSSVVSVVCVKWGTRYGVNYVNILYTSIRRHSTKQFRFFCLTDDPIGLRKQVEPLPLQKGREGWWGKATLFGSQTGLPSGRKFYIDLDMVIVGNIDPLFDYNGQFLTMSSAGLVCEKKHTCGYNSSIMVWNDYQILAPVYRWLSDQYTTVRKFVTRFDYWLQMTVKSADLVQLVYPGLLVDYLQDAVEGVPMGAGVVCFARKPKPQDYPSQWIREHWTQ